MASSSTFFFFFFFFFFFAISPIQSSSSSSNSNSSLSETYSAYEVLASYGFPDGLLPRTVKDYSLESNGRFQLNFYGSCQIIIPDAYPVKFASRVTGTISYQNLQGLTGVTVKILFFWWDISSISVSGSDLFFTVGPFSASFPTSNFEEYPVCEGSISQLFSRSQLTI